MENKKFWAKPFVREVLGTLLLALLFSSMISITLQSSVVEGTSMETNIHEGQWILINKVIYRFHEPERGDIVVFHPPDFLGFEKDLIKRIIGLPGEVVEMKDGVVYIHQPDGNVLTLDENEYIVDPARNYYISDTIPPDNYFVLGDNRNNSTDSEDGWTIPCQDIVGKAWLSIWPISDWGLVPNYSLP